MTGDARRGILALNQSKGAAGLKENYLRGAYLKEGGQEGYPFELPAVRDLDALRFRKPVSFFIGENGSGKSTILEGLAVCMGFNPEGGSRNFHFSTQDTHSALGANLTPVRGPFRPKDGFFLRAESYYTLSSELERLEENGAPGLLQGYGGKSLHARSHGEGFLALMMNRFRGSGLYLMDEPESALSPSRQLSLISLIHQLVRADSQFIIATHSPLLMAYPEADIFEFSEAGIRKVDYRDTEHYRLTRDFLNNPERSLRILMGEEK